MRSQRTAKRGRAWARLGPKALFVAFSLALALIVLGEGPAATALSSALSRIEKIAPPDSGEFTFAVFGDNRGSTRTFERLLEQISSDPEILFAVSTGDVVGIGRRDLFDFFFSQVDRYLTKPLVYAVGNHELLGGGDTLYASLIGARDYSFTFGDAAFIFADDTGGFDPAREELLRTELEAGDGYGETFVFMHVPLYDPEGTEIHHSLDPASAARLMALFKAHRVTHIFCSHIHGFYEGTWEGIPFTISGGAGAPLIGSEPAHYFYHYLKVRVSRGVVTVDTVPVSGNPTVK